MLTPLASEILADLPLHFPEGATLRMLNEWLGEPLERLKPAIYELRIRGLAHAQRTRIHAGERPRRGDRRRA